MTTLNEEYPLCYYCLLETKKDVRHFLEREVINNKIPVCDEHYEYFKTNPVPWIKCEDEDDNT